MSAEQIYRTIDIERRGYGRRYTWLPVDSLTRDEFMIDLQGSYTTPAMLDIRTDDVVRWREGERYIEGRIGEVIREAARLIGQILDAKPLPPESFFP
jgi:hypothetical protein